MIFADENLEQYWIELLRSKGFDVLSIREEKPGISDNAIVELVKDKAGLLITEDKDFGELVFAHGIKTISIIFLRYDHAHYLEIESNLLHSVRLYHDTDLPVFVTITKNKTRVRKL